jgi:hypothetical protein
MFDEPNADLIEAIPKGKTTPYAIVEVLDETEHKVIQFDGTIQLTITKIKCKIVESRPTGDGNKSVDVLPP